MYYSLRVGPLIIFNDLAIAAAVVGWSPVTMKTLIPAVLQSAIAGLTEGLGGSINDTNPINVRLSVGKLY